MEQHAPARAWLEAQFSETESFVGLSWAALYSFGRIASSRRIMGEAAVSVTDAWAAIDAFRSQPTARLVEPGLVHAAIATELVHTPGLSSNDLPDVHLAALAIEHGLVLCTHDHGFARFRALRWMDPVETRRSPEQTG